VKRKHSSCESKKSEESSPKHKKVDIKKVDRDSYNTRLKTDKVMETRSTTVKTKNQSTKVLTTTKQKGGRETKSKAGLTKNNEFRRVTRSMKKT